MAAKTETIQKLKQKNLILQIVKEKLDLKQNLKSFAILATLTGLAVAGRAALQGVPSVETVTPFALLAGFWLGPLYGAVAGASGFYASNFVVWGGQGPWTAFQMAGAAVAGLIGGIFGKLWKGFKWFMLSVVLGVLAYESIVNIGGSLIFYGLFGLPYYFLTSLPFTAIHLVSTMAIVVIFWQFRKALPKLGAKLLHKKTMEVDAENHEAEFIKEEIYKVLGNKKKLISKFSWKKKS